LAKLLDLRQNEENCCKHWHRLFQNMLCYINIGLFIRSVLGYMDNKSEKNFSSYTFIHSFSKSVITFKTAHHNKEMSAILNIQVTGKDLCLKYLLNESVFITIQPKTYSVLRI
jgi:hypothetical protein